MVTLQVSAQNQLRQLIEQIERLEEEKKALAGDIRDKYAEAKATGFRRQGDAQNRQSAQEESRPIGRKKRRSSPPTCTLSVWPKRCRSGR